MSSRAHTSALLAFLRADPGLKDVVFDGMVPGQAPSRYVLVFAQSMDHEVDRMAGRQRPLTARHTIHSIGQVPAEAQWLADKVSARLVGARIPVAGRRSSPVRHESGDPLRVDTGGNSPAVYFLADDYSWVSTP
jgi:hypothetical protein